MRRIAGARRLHPRFHRSATARTRLRRLRRAASASSPAAAPRAPSSTTIAARPDLDACSSRATKRPRPALCWIHWALVAPSATSARSMRGEVTDVLGDAPRHGRGGAQAAVHRPGHRRIAAPALADPFDLARRDGRQHRRWIQDSRRRHGGHLDVRHASPGKPLAGSRKRSIPRASNPRRSRPARASPICRSRPAIAIASAPAQAHGGAQAHRRAHRAALHARTRPRPEDRTDAGHHDVPTLRHEDGDPARGGRLMTHTVSRGEQARQFYNAAATTASTISRS